MEILCHVSHAHTLAQLALVNHTFHSAAESFLYRSITVDMDVTTLRVWETISSHLHLATLVRSLHIQDIEWMLPGVLVAVPSLLRSLRNLQSLTIFLPLGISGLRCGIHPPTLEDILQFDFPQLRAFTANLTFSHTSLARFLSVHPNLEHLDLARAQTSSMAPQDMPSPLPATLCSIACEPRIILRALVLTSPPPALTRIHLTRCDRSILLRLAQLLGAQLVSLRLGGRYRSTANQCCTFGEIVHKFPRLRFFHVDMAHVRPLLPCTTKLTDMCCSPSAGSRSISRRETHRLAQWDGDGSIFGGERRGSRHRYTALHTCVGLFTSRACGYRC